MPRRSPRPCRAPGCPKLVYDRGPYCSAHRKPAAQAYEQARGSAAIRGYGARWRKIRAMYLADNPFCDDPDRRHPGQVRPAIDVDHIIPRAEGGSDDPDNLQALCHSCHSAKTAREKGKVYR